MVNTEKQKKKTKVKKKYMNKEKPKQALVCESSKKQLNSVIKGFRRLCTLVEKPQKGKTKIIKIVNKITIGGGGEEEEEKKRERKVGRQETKSIWKAISLGGLRNSVLA